MATEAQLWRSWQTRRDEGAFESLVRPHLRFLQDFARRLGCGAADADDAVQTTLLELATQKSDKPVRVGLRAWLGRGLRSQIRTLFRARRRRRRHEERAAPPEEIRDKQPLHDEAEAALGQLDDEAREVIVLRFLNDLDYAEIAHILGKSENACRLRVHRAVGRLRRSLGPRAVALVAALPLLAGKAHARAALLTGANVGQTTAVTKSALWGGLLVSTKTKLAVLAALVVVALIGTSALVWDQQQETTPREHTVRRGQVIVTAPPPRQDEPRAEAGQSRPKPKAPLHTPADAPISPGKGSVIGTIHFKGGTPLNGARVALWGASKIEDTTDEQGFFHLHDDWVGDRSLYIKGPRDYAFGLHEIKMKKDERVRIDVVLERGITLACGVVSRATQDPMAGVQVTLRRTVEGRQGRFGFVRTDEQGRFHFEYVPPSGYSLDFDVPGYEGREFRFDLRYDSAPERVELRAARKMTIRIDGAPEAAHGQTISSMMQKDGGGLMPSRKTVLNAKGELVLDAPPPGEWRLTLFRSKHLPRFEKSFTITEQPVEPIVFTITGMRVTGTLHDARGDPVVGGRISGKGLIATTDSEGRFVFENHPVGSHNFYVLFDGGSIKLGNFDVARQLALRLPGTSAVKGVVVADRSESVRGMLEQAGEFVPIGSVRPDEQGRFRIPHLATGPYELSLQHFQGETIVKRFTLTAGATTDLGRIELRRFPPMPVVVSVPAGAKLPKWMTASYPIRSGRMGRHVQLDDSGRGVAIGIPRGSIELYFEADGFETTVLRVSVGDEMAPVQVHLTPSG